MIRTKKQIIDRAFRLIGKNPDVVDIEDEEYLDALLILEVMMNEWYDLNIQVGWTSPDITTLADLDVDSELPDRAFGAVQDNLAIRLAEEFGKMVAPSVMKRANRLYRQLLGHYAKPVNRAKRSVPAGAGQRRTGYCGDKFTTERENDNVVFPAEPAVRFVND